MLEAVWRDNEEEGDLLDSPDDASGRGVLRGVALDAALD